MFTDYLKDTKQYHTDADKVLTGLKKDNLQINKGPLVIDGGNFVVCKGGNYHGDRSINYAVMTDKVMLESLQYSQEEIENLIRDALNNQKLKIVGCHGENVICVVTQMESCIILEQQIRDVL